MRAPGALENEVVVPPREAFLGDADVVAVDEAIGRVSAESIAGYPPGIPALLPGERITTELVAYLRELKASGARLHGASDPQFRTIFVLRRRRSGRRAWISYASHLSALPADRGGPAVGRPAALPRRRRWRATSGASPTRRAAASRSSCAASTGPRRRARGRSSGSPSIPAASSAGRRCRTPRPTPPATACDAGEPRSRPGPTTCALELGPDCRLDASIAAPAGWPRRAFGALGGAQRCRG